MAHLLDNDHHLVFHCTYKPIKIMTTSLDKMTIGSLLEKAQDHDILLERIKKLEKTVRDLERRLYEQEIKSPPHVWPQPIPYAPMQPTYPWDKPFVTY